MTLEKIKELIKKVKALADKGVGGESLSAKEKLKILCQKYNIDEKELEVEDTKEYYFILRDINERELLKNIVCMVLDVPGFKWKERNNCICILLTQSQYDDINDSFFYYQEMYDDYKRYIIQGILARNAVGYVPKPQSYTQEDIMSVHQEEKSEDVDEDKKSEKSEETESNGDQQKSKSENKNEDVVKDAPIDPIKLMKIAVALDKKPWVKPDPNKKLIEKDIDDKI